MYTTYVNPCENKPFTETIKDNIRYLGMHVFGVHNPEKKDFRNFVYTVGNCTRSPDSLELMMFIGSPAYGVRILQGILDDLNKGTIVERLKKVKFLKFRCTQTNHILAMRMCTGMTRDIALQKYAVELNNPLFVYGSDRINLVQIIFVENSQCKLPGEDEWIQEEGEPCITPSDMHLQEWRVGV